MTRSQRASAGSLLLSAMLQGCASYQGMPNLAWFPPATTAAEGQTPGRVALVVPPQVQSTVSAVGESMKLQVGAIAEQAMRATLEGGLSGSVTQVQAAPPPTAGYSATLVINAVRFEHHEKTLWVIWVPPLSQVVRYEASTVLAFDLSLLDPQGRPVWTRTYDDDTGRLVWTTPSANSTPLLEDIGRLVHDSSWRLAQQAFHDLREWMDAERMRPRSI
jgi:hypothetical protein